MTGRRGNGEGSIYQAGDGRWRASVDLGWRGGKRHRKYLTGRTREEVSRKLRKVQQSVDDGVPMSNGRPPTVGEWLEHWLTDIAAAKVRPSTLHTYRGYIDNHLVPGVGRHRLDRLQPEHLDRLYRELGKTLAPASVLQCHRILSRALKVAMQRGRIARNVGTLVDPPSVQRAEATALDAAQARAVLAAAAGRRNAARWSVALALGLRQGEALGLSWESIDFDAGTLAVRQALQRQKGAGLVLVPPKSRAGRRTVGLPAPLVEALRAQRAAQAAERLAAGPDWYDSGLVFTTAAGRPVDPRADYAEWRRLLDVAGVPATALHNARHTAATLLLEQGIPARVVMEMLGHSHVSLTLGTYSHVGQHLLRDAADRMGEALWGG